MDSERQSLKFTFTAGFRQNSKLLYVFDHACLYVRKTVRDGVTSFVCYDYERLGCKARVHIDENNNCFATKGFDKHGTHPNHESLVQEFNVRNNLKRKCSDTKTLLNTQSRRISVARIVQDEEEE